MSSPAPVDGRMHTYSLSKALICFESGNVNGQNILVFYSGLGAGLCSMPVLPRLSAALPPDWSLVQVVSRSSYQGFLTAAMNETVEDMRDVEVYFRGLGKKTGRMVFMGASKACNDVLKFFDTYGQSTTVDSGILLSLTCGRENLLRLFSVEELAESLAIASAQIDSGHGSFPLHAELHDNKMLHLCKGMHAKVWYEIMRPGGPAENFSSTSSDEQLSSLFENLRSFRKNACILIAGEDESVPDTVDKDVLLQRLLRAARGTESVSRGCVIMGANHNMEQETAPEVVVSSILEFLDLTGTRKE